MSKHMDTPAALDKRRDEARRKMGRARIPDLPGKEGRGHRDVCVCVGGGCLASGSLDLARGLRDAVEKAGLSKSVHIVETGCLGPCVGGPAMKILPDDTFYQNVKAADIPEIVEKHLTGNTPVARLQPRHQQTGEIEATSAEMDYFKRQTKIVLRNCGRIDPLSLDEYLAMDGYQALALALTKRTPEAVVQEMIQSGLRGRGGGGFPTGRKWDLCRRAAGAKKNVVCNADEGDPGAFMDRSVLEGDPHSVIEGMALAAFAIGAQAGYVYVRAEYPLAVERLNHAIVEARAAGLLGRKILGADFEFDLEIRMGSGAFVCGEETALMTSIEGKRGEPRPRPPFPANQGLWGLPTLLNNVETFASVAPIILKGAEAYAALGTEYSKGTKVFALAGAVNKTGLVEIPIGMPLGELIFDVGGGIRNDRPFKAAQIGGPSGGCIPRQHLDVPLDYESLIELGAIMGSGGLIVMDDEACMVDVARFFMEFVQEESCGKCPPCRVGTKRLLEILTRICEGKGEMADLDKLAELGEQIKQTALCGLGKTAANPVLSTLRHFRDEYIAHIRDRHCPAGVCASLVRAPCQSACPAGVDVPGFVSLVGEKRYGEALRLHRERNPFAAACARVCFHTCEQHCRRSTLDESVSIRGVKRFMVDQEVTVITPEMRENAANAKRNVVIVGAGPAGLSCAYFLARLGYQPTVYEAESRPGGMMVQTIPSYRLPREILAREIRMIERMGVTIETGKKLGRDFTLEDLKKQGVEAVFVAVGAPRGSRLGIPGEEAEGVTEAIRFLRQYNIRGSAPAGKKVVVIGGGNAAIDAARTVLRLGAQEVTIVYRRTREEMPAYTEEIEEAEHEGVKLRLLTAPVEVVVEDGKAVGLRCAPMQLGGFDKSGRRKPVAGTDGAFVIECDQIIAAVGQSLDAKALLHGAEVKLRSDHYIAASPVDGQTSVPWIFAGGDAVVGPSSVIDAIAAGEKAAEGMDRLLTGATHAFWRQEKQNTTAFDPDADPAPTPRERQRLVPVERRRSNFDEVEQSWTEPEAVRQAKRCLRCDYGKNVATW